MLKLMKLEFRQNRFWAYLLATFVITAGLTGFAYLFAYMPHVKPSNVFEEMAMGIVVKMFGSYENISVLVCVLSMTCFGVLCSAVMSRAVVSDYISKRANLMFSYPVNRGKMFLSKVLLSFIFSVAASFLSTALALAIFFSTERYFPMVTGDVLSADILIFVFKVTLIFSLLSGGIGLVSLWFGFKRKSTIATLIPAFIITSFLSNVFGVPMLVDGASGSIALQIIITVISLIVGILLTANLVGAVNRMEAV